MMINATVWHKTVPSFSFNAVAENTNVNLSDFTKVAVLTVVEHGALDIAYTRSNNIDSAWIEGSDVVERFVSGGCRSTSMGDMIEVDGKFSLVAAFGFVPVVVK